MRLVPMVNRNYGLDLFDEFFRVPTFREFNARNFMKTDIHETDSNYIMDIDMPGVAKENISIDLENGYLKISAKQNTSNEKKDEKGNIIHQERYCGEMSRSYYVGEKLDEESIKASYADGILSITFPKEVKKEEQKKVITIE